ncbi:hypothetical protein HDU83_008037 [Entophlyctis luteolus]|nr:hypothetical protein HDU83_008037 [Entophlyctis luteolus]
MPPLPPLPPAPAPATASAPAPATAAPPPRAPARLRNPLAITPVRSLSSILAEKDLRVSPSPPYDPRFMQDAQVWTHSRALRLQPFAAVQFDSAASVSCDNKLAQLLQIFPEHPLDVLVQTLEDCANNVDAASSIICEKIASNVVEPSLRGNCRLICANEHFAVDSLPKKKGKLVKKSTIGMPINVSLSSPTSNVRDPLTIKRKREFETEKSLKFEQASLVSDADTDSESSDSGGKYDTIDNEEEIENQAFGFFANADRRELIDTLVCTDEQADAILEFRPFVSKADMREKFEIHKRGKKRISKLLEKYRTLMHGYVQVDRLISKCETTGGEVMSVMKSWIARTQSNSIGIESFSEKSETSSAQPESSEDGGLHIASLLFDGEFEGAPKFLHNQPGIMNDKMKLTSYQLVGVNWLNLLYHKKLGGILADEMGLGKTAQVISFISHIKEQGESGSPHLIVVPSSTLENWLREFQNWSPSLMVLSYYGSQADRETIRQDLADGNLPEFDVVVTTYNLASGSADDRKFLRRLKPRSLVLDEGHMVKNMQSSRYQNLNQIAAPFRLLLTGTPLQNNLMELLSLLTFIMPRIFANDEDALRQIFSLKNTSSSEEALLNKQRITRAKQMMTPFVLRRKKADVLTELPGKVKKTVLCGMTANQQALYKSIVAECKKSMFAKLHQDEFSAEKSDSIAPASKKQKKAVKPTNNPAFDGSNVLMQLRKAANHPLLFRRIYDDLKIKTMAREIMKEDQYVDASMDCILEDMSYLSDFQLHNLCKKFKSIRKHALTNDEWMDSGKVETLKNILPDLIAKGDRVLIFSQFVIMLDVLETVLETLDIKFLRLDGSTNVTERQPLIDEFNDDSSIGVFLLSTKAGGLGLNLTCANVVILHDMDFNPHNDAQAEDRAHRVGQTREVTVLKLVVSKSVEEHILKLATTKLQLDKSLQQTQSQMKDSDWSGKDSKPELPSTDEPDASTDDKRLMEILRDEWKESD